MADKFYAVVTRDADTIVHTWDDAQDFLRAHPGMEFHKKFSTEGAAQSFIKEKRLEFGHVAKVLKAESILPTEPVAVDTDYGDPPW